MTNILSTLTRPIGLQIHCLLLFFLLVSTPALAQQAGVITGVVTDADHLPLIGAIVEVKGSNKPVDTNTTGEYTIEAVEGDTLIFHHLGFVEKHLAVEGSQTINVELQTVYKQLNEVVVVGYGAQKRSSITSAVSTVTSKELTQSPSANISNMITGRITGVTSIQDQGSPGNDQSRIYIRGVATTGNTEPLYVIDGIPRTATDFNRLAPGDIANVSALKDAAAAAVYGARAANGVILVTTKRGVAGKTSFSYSYNLALQKATRLPKYINSAEYARLYNAALKNEGRPELYTAGDIQKYQDGSDPVFHPNTDWLSILKKEVPMQQHNLSLNGGTEKIKFFMSLGYLNQKSLMSHLNSQLGYKRYNFRSNIDVQATTTTKVNLDLAGYLSTRIEPGAGYPFVFENINRDASVYTGRYPNGLNGTGYSNRNGWVAVNESGYQSTGNNALLSRIEISQDIPQIKGFSLKAIAGFDYSPSSYKKWSLPMPLYNAVQTGENIQYDLVSGTGSPNLYDSNGLETNLLLEAHAIYKRTFFKHEIGGLLLCSQQDIKGLYLAAYRSDFLSNVLDIINAGGTSNQYAAGTAGQYHRQSLVGRVNYAYDKRYLLEFNFRSDASDLFAQGKRVGFFPAFSAGWLISRETFMKNVSFIDNLKLRTSYGVLGNDRIGQYQYLQFYGYGGGLPFGDASKLQSNIQLTRLANRDVTWERSKKGNIGFDADFLENFSLNFDYFWENRIDILGQRSATIPATVGVAGGILPFENFAKVNNKGFEIGLSYQKLLQNGLQIKTHFNVSRAKNQVVDIGEPADKPDRIRQMGRSLNAVFGYKALGFFQSENEITAAYGTNHPNLKPGDIRYEDLNGDRKIDGDDITYIGSNNLPVNIYGLSTTLSYKGIDFSMFWQAGTGNQQLFANWMAIPFNQAGNALVAHQDYWRPDNTSAKYPRITTSSQWNYDNVSSFWLYNMRYLRLKNVEIAYSFQGKWIKKMATESLRIYFNGSNLLTFSPYKEVDPENTNGNGIYYPQQVIYNLGVQVSF